MRHCVECLPPSVPFTFAACTNTHLWKPRTTRAPHFLGERSTGRCGGAGQWAPCGPPLVGPWEVGWRSFPLVGAPAGRPSPHPPLHVCMTVSVKQCGDSLMATGFRSAAEWSCDEDDLVHDGGAPAAVVWSRTAASPLSMSTKLVRGCGMPVCSPLSAGAPLPPSPPSSPLMCPSFFF
jgi:hypothetical protein